MSPTPVPFSPSPSSTAAYPAQVSSGADADAFETNGGYIYVILSVAFLVAAAFFGRVYLAKRKERKQLQKEHDCEVLPDYHFHLSDRRLDESAPVQIGATRPPSRPCVPPPAVARLRSSDMFDPPAYDEMARPKSLSRSGTR